MMRSHRPIAIVLLTLWLSALSGSPARGQDVKYNRELCEAMLHDGYQAVKKNYYDPGIRGQDWEKNYKEHLERVKGMANLGQGLFAIAGMLETLNDSHTFFLPPSRAMRIEYGFKMEMVGARAFVIRVRPGSDAESKIHPGDEILKFSRFSVDRDDMWKLEYAANELSPLTNLPLTVRAPDGRDREVVIAAKIIPEKRVTDLTNASERFWFFRKEEREEGTVQQLVEKDDVLFWKLRAFFLSEGEIGDVWGKARKHRAVVLDLRDDGGGSTEVLKQMVGNLFDHDVKIADRKTRKDSKEMKATGRGGKAYQGKLIVLVNSRSASAAEMFARVAQLEKRGVVVGDRSEGAVMEAVHYPMSQGMDTKIFYGFSVTEADLIMTDGKSLENAGVTPDEVVLPTAEDIASGKDPALVRAAELAGVKLDPVEAGKMFKFEWKVMD